MAANRLQHLFATGRWTLPVSIVCASALLLTSTLLALRGGMSPAAASTSTLVSLLLYAATGYLLIDLNNAFPLIRLRATIQTSIYFLLVAACPAFHLRPRAVLAAMLLLLAVFFLFKSFRRAQEAPAALFYSFLFLGFGSFFAPKLTLLAPVFWIGAYGFQSLHRKSFFASITGWLVPYWFVLAAALWSHKIVWVSQPLRELFSFHALSYQGVEPWQIATMGYLLALFAVSSLHSLRHSHQDKTNTRSFLRFLLFLTASLFLYALLQPAGIDSTLPFLLVLVCALGGHFVIQATGRVGNLLIGFFSLAFVLLFLFNVWTLW
ncbi:MAG: hypothetical protein LBM06_08600 [Prevotellaceae bacterium]|jgi:hypothetical protein|nr:hypothetical protein [Prevotellaceae bacterium]